MALEGRLAMPWYSIRCPLSRDVFDIFVFRYGNFQLNKGCQTLADCISAFSFCLLQRTMVQSMTMVSKVKSNSNFETHRSRSGNALATFTVPCSCRIKSFWIKPCPYSRNIEHRLPRCIDLAVKRSSGFADTTLTGGPGLVLSLQNVPPSGQSFVPAEP